MIVIDDRFCREYSNFSNEDYSKVVKIKEVILKKEKMLDWIDLDTTITKQEINKIITIGNKIKEEADIFLVIGIGGSYLGSKAIIDAFTSYFKKNKPEIIFLGYNLSSNYLKEILDYIKKKNVYINVISKSGNTLETDVSFKILYNYLKENDSNYREKIIITTDKETGLLRKIADEEKITSFTIPQNIGGRFSVLTTVGLLPVLVAGIDIIELLNGAYDNQDIFEEASKFALIRNNLENKLKTVEMITFYEEKLNTFSLWYQQLFAETQGKNQEGILPIPNPNTTNLHSLGQYLQDGRKQVFETVIKIEKSTDTNLYYKNKKIDDLNNIVLEQVALAHKDGNTPSIIITIPTLTPYYLGKLIYFLELSATIGAYLLDVYPFDQPGVEKYKENVRKKLGDN